MKQKIQNLIIELMSYTDVRNDKISGGAKGILGQVREALKQLESSDDPNKQSKMISLFVGGTISALVMDQEKYRYEFKLYPCSTVDDVRKDAKTAKIELPFYEFVYAIGDKALSNLPKAFSGELFKIEGELINTLHPMPFFPELARNADKVDQLVEFCMRHQNNLNYVKASAADLVEVGIFSTDTAKNKNISQELLDNSANHGLN